MCKWPQYYTSALLQIGQGYRFSFSSGILKETFLHSDHELWGSGKEPVHPGEKYSLETRDEHQVST